MSHPVPLYLLALAGLLAGTHLPLAVGAAGNPAEATDSITNGITDGITASATVAAPAAAPEGAVSVRFVHPEAFTDATYYHRERTRSEVTRDIAALFGELGRRYLPAGERLEIEVRDIDLAGRYEPWQIQSPDIRYLRDLDWPRVKLHYRLTRADGTIEERDEDLADLNYLQRTGIASSGDRLRYEKLMLDDWFRTRFARPTP